MDTMAMVSTMLASQQGALQSNVAATLMKQNADAEKSAVLTLMGAGRPSLAHSAGPAIVAISQPCGSTSTEVGMPRARPIALRS
jgi:hypothetical protein